MADEPRFRPRSPDCKMHAVSTPLHCFSLRKQGISEAHAPNLPWSSNHPHARISKHESRHIEICSFILSNMIMASLVVSTVFVSIPQ